MEVGDVIETVDFALSRKTSALYLVKSARLARKMGVLKVKRVSSVYQSSAFGISFGEDRGPA
jgi:hypothetical protein